MAVMVKIKGKFVGQHVCKGLTVMRLVCFRCYNVVEKPRFDLSNAWDLFKYYAHQDIQMKNLVKISFLYLIFLISGCVQLPSEVRQINGVMHYMAPLEVYKKLRTTKPCCNSYSEIEYSELSLNRNVLFLINSDSPAYKFETGKSYFAAFRLPSR